MTTLHGKHANKRTQDTRAHSHHTHSHSHAQLKGRVRTHLSCYRVPYFWRERQDARDRKRPGKRDRKRQNKNKERGRESERARERERERARESERERERARESASERESERASQREGPDTKQTIRFVQLGVLNFYRVVFEYMFRPHLSDRHLHFLARHVCMPLTTLTFHDRATCSPHPSPQCTRH